MDNLNTHQSNTHKFFRGLLFLILIGLAIHVSAQAPNISYQTPQSYVINNAIAALSPTNTGGAVPAMVYGTTSTYAIGYFNNVTGVALDATGNLYVESWGTNQIFKVTSAITYSVFAGGNQGSNDGQGTTARFYEPDAIISDATGNFYISDQGNNLIRKITSGGLVTTVAGNGANSLINGIGTAASFNSPRGLAIDASGNLYVADQANNAIRKITPTGIVTTYAGSGANGSANGAAAVATFNSPCGIGIDAAGNLYVGDSGNNLIRKITTAGVVSTFASGFNFPREIRVDGTGNLYVVDQGSNTVKRVSPSGIVTTIVGTGAPGSTNGPGNSSTVNSPIGLVLDGNGNLFLGDSGNNSVRKIVISGYTIDKPLPAGLSFDPKTGIINGTPTALSPATNYTITAYNGGGSSTTVVSIQVILPKASIITFPPIINPIVDVNNNVVPGATSTNNETIITYTSSNPAVATITPNGLIHLVGPGVTIITASQAGNANYSPATSVIETLTVTESQVIIFAAIPDKTTCDADFAINAKSFNNTIPITYTSSNPAVATISSQGIVHIISAGKTTITTNQAGNNLYTPADPVSQLLTINATVVPLVTISPNVTSVCTGSPVTFLAQVSNLSTNLSYQWQLNGVNAGTNSNTFTFVPLANTDAVICVVTNNTLCPATGSSNSYTGIVINPILTPTINITSSATAAVCDGTPITFTASPTGGGTGQPTYNWQINGITQTTNTAIFTNNTFADGDVVTCTVSYTGYACYSSPTFTSNPITVGIITPTNPYPSVSITASANNVYLGTSITFTALPVNAGTVNNYQWSKNGKVVGSNSDTYTSATIHNKDIITCTITSSLPCTVPATSNILTMIILPPPTVKIPNTFTPNGDSFNDTWNIPDLVAYPNCAVSIYNRNGGLLYQSKGYEIAWDGTTKGKQLPVATYYYVIDLGDKQTKLTGWIAIIK